MAPRSILQTTSRIMRRIKKAQFVFGILFINCALFTCTLIIFNPKARLIKPFPSFYVEDRYGEFIAQFETRKGLGPSNNLGYGYWPLKDLPKRVAAATIAIEDNRFWYHLGVDPIAIIRALWQNWTSSKRVSGASTIAMQIVRMQNPAPRTLKNKVAEALVAFLITLKYHKRDILKHYLQIVPYGNQSHGIFHAAKIYLNKPAADLSWAEIAFLSAIPQAPSRMSPYALKGRWLAKKRGARILKKLLDKNVITNSEYDLAGTQLEQLHVNSILNRPSHLLHAINRLKTKLAKIHPKPKNPIIKTSLDVNIHNHLYGEIKKNFPEFQNKGASHIAAILIERKRMEVVSYLGSLDYFENAGAIDYVTTNRSPGSTLKPFIYAQALEKNILLPNSILFDTQVESHGIQNADFRFLGPMLPRKALANSRNVPAANLLTMVGIDEIYFLLFNLKIHNSQLPSQYFGTGMAIGSLSTTLELIVQAYGTLANDGQFKPLSWLPELDVQSQRTFFSTQTARLITLFLSDPMARLPSFPRMGSTEFPFPVALKTGTSQGYRDAWIIAYTNTYILGIWIGRADHQSMAQLGGAGAAGPIAKKILLMLHPEKKDGLFDLSFPPPKGYQSVLLCSKSGLLAEDKCHQTTTEWIPDHLLAEIAATQHMKKNLTEKEYKLQGQNNIAIQITNPEPGERMVFNPNVPKKFNSLVMQAKLSRHVNEVLWLVDNEPYKLSQSPYSAVWPLKKGPHTIQAQIPFRPERSNKIHIWVE